MLPWGTQTTKLSKVKNQFIWRFIHPNYPGAPYVDEKNETAKQSYSYAAPSVWNNLPVSNTNREY